ncbi:polymorphic toxin type 28 domain-containing protein [Herbihabitans rhizosphaerae]|uniref:polymorphic toxin type 28 domain-containing protein n=1 Tax=Herbihabitans rhizosphaerae TaxID=1872711 RepID=UPI00102D0D28|nr:polymorphic toxin type 28 domain-containing protein [Herbihabitans rhizosphaerae]
MKGRDTGPTPQRAAQQARDRKVTKSSSTNSNVTKKSLQGPTPERAAQQARDRKAASSSSASKFTSTNKPLQGPTPERAAQQARDVKLARADQARKSQGPTPERAAQQARDVRAARQTAQPPKRVYGPFAPKTAPKPQEKSLRDQIGEGLLKAEDSAERAIGYGLKAVRDWAEREGNKERAYPNKLSDPVTMRTRVHAGVYKSVYDNGKAAASAFDTLDRASGGDKKAQQEIVQGVEDFGNGVAKTANDIKNDPKGSLNKVVENGKQAFDDFTKAPSSTTGEFIGDLVGFGKVTKPAKVAGSVADAGRSAGRGGDRAPATDESRADGPSGSAPESARGSGGTGRGTGGSSGKGSGPGGAGPGGGGKGPGGGGNGPGGGNGGGRGDSGSNGDSGTGPRSNRGAPPVGISRKDAGRKNNDKTKGEPTQTDKHKKHLKRSDLDGARRESGGEVVKRKAKTGVPYDHVDEVQNSQRGLLNQIDWLNKKLDDSRTSDADKKKMEAELGEASKLLDRSEGFLPRLGPDAPRSKANRRKAKSGVPARGTAGSSANQSRRGGVPGAVAPQGAKVDSGVPANGDAGGRGVPIPSGAAPSTFRPISATLDGERLGPPAWTRSETRQAPSHAEVQGRVDDAALPDDFTRRSTGLPAPTGNRAPSLWETKRERKQDPEGKLFEAEASAVTGKRTWPLLGGRGEATSQFGADASVNAGAGWGVGRKFTDTGWRHNNAGPAAEAGAKFSGGWKGDAKVDLERGPVRGRVKGNIVVGAEAKGSLRSNKEGFTAAGDAIGGAKLGIRGQVDVAGIGVGANAGVMAGLGARGHVTAGKGADGLWHLRGEGGAALGVGAEAGFDLSLDVARARAAAVAAGEAIGDGAVRAGLVNAPPNGAATADVTRQAKKGVPVKKANKGKKSTAKKGKTKKSNKARGGNRGRR